MSEIERLKAENKALRELMLIGEHRMRDYSDETARLREAIETCRPIVKHRACDGSEEAEMALAKIEEALK